VVFRTSENSSFKRMETYGANRVEMTAKNTCVGNTMYSDCVQTRVQEFLLFAHLGGGLGVGVRGNKMHFAHLLKVNFGFHVLLTSSLVET
jgi:hypothetical protein